MLGKKVTRYLSPQEKLHNIGSKDYVMGRKVMIQLNELIRGNDSFELDYCKGIGTTWRLLFIN